MEIFDTYDAFLNLGRNNNGVIHFKLQSVSPISHFTSAPLIFPPALKSTSTSQNKRSSAADGERFLPVSKSVSRNREDYILNIFITSIRNTLLWVIFVDGASAHMEE